MTKKQFLEHFKDLEMLANVLRGPSCTHNESFHFICLDVSINVWHTANGNINVTYHNKRDGSNVLLVNEALDFNKFSLVPLLKRYLLQGEIPKSIPRDYSPVRWAARNIETS